MNSRAAYRRAFSAVEDAYSRFARTVAEIVASVQIPDQIPNRVSDPRQRLNDRVRAQLSDLQDMVSDDRREIDAELAAPDEPLDPEDSGEWDRQFALLTRRLDRSSDAERAGVWRELADQALEVEDVIKARVLTDLYPEVTAANAASTIHGQIAQTLDNGQRLRQLQRLAAPSKRSVFEHQDFLTDQVKPPLDNLQMNWPRRAELIVREEGEDLMAGAFSVGADGSAGSRFTTRPDLRNGPTVRGSTRSSGPPIIGS